MQSPDQNVERNRQLLLDRSVAGLKKYGVTTERDDLTLNEWLQHLLEELLDAANYIQAAKVSAQKTQTIHLGQPGVTIEPCLMLGPDEEEVACLLFTAPGTEVRLTWPTQTQAAAVLAAATAEDCTEADAQPVSCECGDSYPLSSHGAGFIEGRGHCANCAAGSGEMASLLGVSPAPVERGEREAQQSEPVAIWDDMTKLARAISNRRIKHGAPLYAAPQPAAPAAQDVAVLVSEAAFLLDRLSDMEQCLVDDDLCREYQGHVVPSAERLRMLLDANQSGDAA